MCVCKSVGTMPGSLVTQVQAEKLGLIEYSWHAMQYSPTKTLIPTSSKYYFLLFKCTDCGQFWESVPCTPYWCEAETDITKLNRYRLFGTDKDPNFNRGYILQKRYVSKEKWWQELNYHFENACKPAINSRVERFKLEGYDLVERGDMSAIFYKEIPKKDLFSQEQRVRVKMGVDKIGRIFCEHQTTSKGGDITYYRTGDDPNGPLFME